jgi:hypothetical protein
MNKNPASAGFSLVLSSNLASGSRTDHTMMAAVFATMSLALICGWFGRRSLAVALLVFCLTLSIGLFLFEIYSPETGFRMPWIQTEFEPMPKRA